MLTTLIGIYTITKFISADWAQNGHLAWNSAALLQASAVPVQNQQNLAPVIKAKAAIATDLENGFILYEKNIHDRRPVASLTKLMTAIIILEENNLNDTVTVSVSQKGAQIGGSKIWLAPGEKITVENLLYATLIHSANDAAYALAIYNSENNPGQTQCGSIDCSEGHSDTPIKNFVKKMNEKAMLLGLQNTNFTNPVGLDEEGNYSSAYDLSILGRYAYKKDFIRKAAIIREMEITSKNGRLKHKISTTNDLLGSYLKVLGLKTGTTAEAGECLVAVIKNDDGNNILTVLLDSGSRYQETKVLVDWLFRTYNWK